MGQGCCCCAFLRLARARMHTRVRECVGARVCVCLSLRVIEFSLTEFRDFARFNWIGSSCARARDFNVE